MSTSIYATAIIHHLMPLWLSITPYVTIVILLPYVIVVILYHMSLLSSFTIRHCCHPSPYVAVVILYHMSLLSSFTTCHCCHPSPYVTVVTLHHMSLLSLTIHDISYCSSPAPPRNSSLRLELSCRFDGAIGSP